jgi:hypothetical protein
MTMQDVPQTARPHKRDCRPPKRDCRPPRVFTGKPPFMTAEDEARLYARDVALADEIAAALSKIKFNMERLSHRLAEHDRGCRGSHVGLEPVASQLVERYFSDKPDWLKAPIVRYLQGYVWGWRQGFVNWGVADDVFAETGCDRGIREYKRRRQREC